MEAKRLFDEKMQQIKNKSEHYEKRISEKINELKKWADPDTLWPRVKEGSLKILADKRTIMIGAGMVVSFLVIRALLSSRRRGRLTLAEGRSMNTKAPFRTGKSHSLLYEMTIMAIQTFLLHYARKILLQFLEGKKKSIQSPPLPTTVNDVVNPS